MKITAIIVDDEPLLAEYLRAKLQKQWPELTIVGIAHNGRSALTLAAAEQPDIAFLDIHMPGLSGLQVAENLPAKTKIVFVTAFDQHAIEAFQRAAVDYLLKPVMAERLQYTIDRLKHAPAIQPDLLVSLIQDLTQDLSRESKRYLQWLRAGIGDTTTLVSEADVVYLKSDHKYTEIFTQQKSYVVRRSIKELEEELDPNQFWRIHRGTMVRVDQIIQAKRDLRGRYTISLRDRSEELLCSQSYGHLFKQM